MYETVVIGNGVEDIVNPTLAKLGLAEEELRKALKRPRVVDIEIFHVGNLVVEVFGSHRPVEIFLKHPGAEHHVVGIFGIVEHRLAQEVRGFVVIAHAHIAESHLDKSLVALAVNGKGSRPGLDCLVVLAHGAQDFTTQHIVPGIVANHAEGAVYGIESLGIVAQAVVALGYRGIDAVVVVEAFVEYGLIVVYGGEVVIVGLGDDGAYVAEHTHLRGFADGLAQAGHKR